MDSPEDGGLVGGATAKVINRHDDSQVKAMVQMLAGPAPSDGIVLSLTSGVWDDVAMVHTFGSVVCTLVDDGEHTVPAALLSQLPVNPYSGIALSIVRMKQAQAQVPLARGGNGWVILRGETSCVAECKPSWVTSPAK